MKENIIAKELSDLLPDRPASTLEAPSKTEALINEQASKICAKHDAQEMARFKYREKQRLKALEAKKAEDEAFAKENGLDPLPEGQTRHQALALKEQREKVEALEALEAETLHPLLPSEIAKKPTDSYPSGMGKALQLQGATRPEIAKVLTALNINLSVQLSKSDTANLLACLLTCNEAQLHALRDNKKVPIVIKTIIKRLLEDLRLGNTDMVEKLWDRVFGKGPMQLDLPTDQKLQAGIIPNTPVSREAYIIIRDSLIK